MAVENVCKIPKNKIYLDDWLLIFLVVCWMARNETMMIVKLAKILHAGMDWTEKSEYSPGLWFCVNIWEDI